MTTCRVRRRRSERIRRFIERFFRRRRKAEPGGPGWNLPPEVGVREPRRPRPTAGAGAVALPEPIGDAFA